MTSYTSGHNQRQDYVETMIVALGPSRDIHSTVARMCPMSERIMGSRHDFIILTLKRKGGTWEPGWAVSVGFSLWAHEEVRIPSARRLHRDNERTLFGRDIDCMCCAVLG